MKSIIFLLFLCSCAVGTSESEPTPEPVTYGTRPAPTAPPPAPEDPKPANSNCHVYSEWINDCLVTSVYCLGKPVRIDVSCSGGPDLFSWKNIPDPPPPWVDTNSNRK